MGASDPLEFDEWCDANYHAEKAPGKGLDHSKNPPEPYTRQFMKTVLKLKLEQHPHLKKLAIDMAREGIFPVEMSQYDVNWASGPNGTGENMLGQLILELGNDYLKELGETPAITNPRQYYESFKSAHHQSLSHSNLVLTLSTVNQSQIQPNSSIASGSVPTPAPQVQYYTSNGGNQRLVTQGDQVIGYEFRCSSSSG